MPNGKLGDHPLTDIVHGRRVYSERADALVREILSLADRRQANELGDLLGSRFDPWARPDLAELERVLADLRDRLRRERQP